MQWSQTYSGSVDKWGHSVVETSDGGYAIIGSTELGAERPDILLVKTDSAGNMQWNKTHGGKNNDYGYSVVETSDGGYALAGFTNLPVTSSSIVHYYFLLVKTDEYGVVPEASWIILPLLLIATLTIFVSKKKLLHKKYRKRS